MTNNRQAVITAVNQLPSVRFATVTESDSGIMLKYLAFIMMFVFVVCGDNKTESKEASRSNEMSTTTPAPQSASNESKVSEGLKAVTNGAKQILSGVLEVGSGIFNAISEWFDGDQKH